MNVHRYVRQRHATWDVDRWRCERCERPASFELTAEVKRREDLGDGPYETVEAVDGWGCDGGVPQVIGRRPLPT